MKFQKYIKLIYKVDIYSTVFTIKLKYNKNKKYQTNKHVLYRIGLIYQTF